MLIGTLRVENTEIGRRFLPEGNEGYVQQFIMERGLMLQCHKYGNKWVVKLGTEDHLMYESAIDFGTPDAVSLEQCYVSLAEQIRRDHE